VKTFYFRHAFFAWRNLKFRQIWNKVTKFLEFLRIWKVLRAIFGKVKNIWPIFFCSPPSKKLFLSPMALEETTVPMLVFFYFNSYFK